MKIDRKITESLSIHRGKNRSFFFLLYYFFNFLASDWFLLFRRYIVLTTSFLLGSRSFLSIQFSPSGCDDGCKKHDAIAYSFLASLKSDPYWKKYRNSNLWKVVEPTWKMNQKKKMKEGNRRSIEILSVMYIASEIRVLMNSQWDGRWNIGKSNLGKHQQTASKHSKRIKKGKQI